jgi:hypothetical protein
MPAFSRDHLVGGESNADINIPAHNSSPALCQAENYSNNNDPLQPHKNNENFSGTNPPGVFFHYAA